MLNPNFIYIPEYCSGSEFPKNTVASLKRLIKSGFHNLSVSAQLCAENEVIAFHSELVEEEIHEKGFTKYFSKDELSQAYFRTASVHVGVSSLEDIILATLNAKEQCTLNIELRSQGMFVPIANLLDRLRKGGHLGDFGTQINLTFSSKHHVDLVHLKRLVPEVSVLAIIQGTPLDYTNSISRAGINGVIIDSEFANLHLIRDADDNGLSVYLRNITDIRVVNKLRAEHGFIAGAFVTGMPN